MDSDGEVDGTYEREEQQRSEDEGAPESVSGEADVDEREMDAPAAVIGSDEDEEQPEQEQEQEQEEEEEEEVVVKAKPRKRLVKMSVASPVDEDEGYVEEREEEDEEEEVELEEPSFKRKGHDREAGDARKKLKKSKGVSKGKKEITKKRKSGDSNVEKLARLAKGGGRSAEKQQGSGRKGEKEMKEMWDSVAGNGEDSEDDKEGLPDDEDDRFIDDAGVPEDERYISDGEAGSAGEAPQAEEAEEGDEDEDVGKFFKSGKKTSKKFERTPEEIAMFVEQFMAKLDVAAETDADLNRASKPAIEKLKMLPELCKVLEKRQLQQEFLDRGVLSSLKNWLEPLPDGSLPNMNIRTALLKLLTDLPIDVELFERREQLKKSGLGKVVMFLSRLPEETAMNKKLARDLVDKWSRPIFQKSTRYEDLRSYDEERPAPRRTPAKKPSAKYNPMESKGGDDLDLVHRTGEPKPGDVGYRQHASRPEALPLDFVRRPESKVDLEEIANRARQQRMDEKRMKMNKKLQQLKTPKKKTLQASRISVEGRGVVSYQ